MKSKDSEAKQPEEEIKPFQISYTKFTNPGTRENIKAQLADLGKTLNEFYRIANRIKNGI